MPGSTNENALHCCRLGALLSLVLVAHVRNEMQRFAVLIRYDVMLHSANLPAQPQNLQFH